MRALSLTTALLLPFVIAACDEAEWEDPERDGVPVPGAFAADDEPAGAPGSDDPAGHPPDPLPDCHCLDFANEVYTDCRSGVGPYDGWTSEQCLQEAINVYNDCVRRWCF